MQNVPKIINISDIKSKNTNDNGGKINTELGPQTELVSISGPRSNCPTSHLMAKTNIISEMLGLKDTQDWGTVSGIIFLLTVTYEQIYKLSITWSSKLLDRLCGLVVTVLGYRSRGPGSIPGTTRKKKE
jgi:hypothetical protein